MARTAFYAHLAAAILLVDGPLWSLHWALGLIALPIIVLAVEIVHGLFDDVFDALVGDDLDLGTGEGLTYTRPPLPRPANRIEEKIRRRINGGDGA